MSPAATGGLPYRRATSISGGSVGMANRIKVNGTEPSTGTNRVFPPLEDLVSVKLDPDMIHWPMRRLLSEGDLLAKQADTHLDFRRPDVALQEYIKATIIAVDYIPHHKDYPSLKADRGDLHWLHEGLNRRINQQHAKFASIKELIKENNAMNGVAPTRSVAGVADRHAMGSSHVRTQSVPGRPATHTNGTTYGRRPPPPPVSPKPEALHGNSIHADLASRFARLRSSEPAIPAQQDPRIKTQPIVIPENSSSPGPQTTASGTSSINRPTGPRPREMPSVPHTTPRHVKIPLGVSIPTMPRAPDAIYSPACSADSATTVNLPSSIARSSSYLAFGRHNSAPPVSTVGPTPDVNENKKDYFSTPRTMPDDDFGGEVPKHDAPHFPNLDTITAEELVKYKSQSVSILIVDVRTREEFDSGHIMSQSIICVEPVTLRHGISGEQLGESLVIAPDPEQTLYEARADFDLIVYYDQNSRTINSQTPVARDSNNALRDFAAAVYEYGYENRAKRRPLLLVGGLEAWIDLLGPNSLKSSTTNKSTSIAKHTASRSIGRFNMAKSRSGYMNNRSSRMLSSDEEMKWDLALRKEDASNNSGSEDQFDLNEFVYARTVDAFLNKYPEMPVIQESMVSQPPAVRYTNVTPDDFDSSIPQLPTRPPPALPRQRSSGLSDITPIVSYASGAGTISTLQVSPGLTGLDNPNFLCYFNSSIQALSATPFLRELARNFSPGDLPVPLRPGETTDPPQLLLRFFSNLIRNLWSGQYDWVKPTSLARYVNTIHYKSNHATVSNVKAYCFGGVDQQHDAAEFLLWFLEVLDDEINPQRDQRPDFGRTNLTTAEIAEQAKLPLNQASQFAWSLIMKGQGSILAQNLFGQMCNVITCTSCNASSRNWSDFQQLPVSIPDNSPRSTTLLTLLGGMFGAGGRSTLPGLVDCDSAQCKREENWKTGDPLPKRTKVQNAYLTRLPKTLVITLSRFINNPYTGASRRNDTIVNFPEHNIDLEPYFCPRDATPDDKKDQEHRPPFKYSVYAVQRHSGSLVSGHYTTMARSPGLAPAPHSAGSWHHFNDKVVTPCTFRDTQDNNQSYVIYMERMGTSGP